MIKLKENEMVDLAAQEDNLQVGDIINIDGKLYILESGG